MEHPVRGSAWRLQMSVLRRAWALFIEC